MKKPSKAYQRLDKKIPQDIKDKVTKRLDEIDRIHFQKEYILCAAIWYKYLVGSINKDLPIMTRNPINCDKGFVFCGHRHSQCLYTMVGLTGLRSVTNAEDGVGVHIQGFLTSKNRFVDRGEGAKVAFESGQIKELKRHLFSEDLY